MNRVTPDLRNPPEHQAALPRFYNHAEIRSLEWAAKHANRCTSSIRNWGKKHGIAWLVCDRIVVSEPALQMLLSGDFVALEKWRSGDVTAVEVRFYYDKLDIQLPATASTAG
jgi:hypothetical protein